MLDCARDPCLAQQNRLVLFTSCDDKMSINQSINQSKALIAVEQNVTEYNVRSKIKIKERGSAWHG